MRKTTEGFFFVATCWKSYSGLLQLVVRLGHLSMCPSFPSFTHLHKSQGWRQTHHNSIHCDQKNTQQLPATNLKMYKASAVVWQRGVGCCAASLTVHSKDSSFTPRGIGLKLGIRHRAILQSVRLVMVSRIINEKKLVWLELLIRILVNGSKLAIIVWQHQNRIEYS